MVILMKLRVLSDLHLEFIQDKYNPDRARRKLPRYFDHALKSAGEADVLLVAGDLTSGVEANLRGATEAIVEYFDGPVVYVAGNHEYYRSDFEAVDEILREQTGSIDNLYWLNDETVTINGQRFVGTTLWFPERPDNTLYTDEHNDFSQIDGFVPAVYERHEDARSFLRETLEPTDVVLTHHLPGSFAVPEAYQSDEHNRFYDGRVEDILQQTQPRLWHFGHTHDTIAIERGGVRFICNPLGYPNNRENPQFQPQYTVEL